MKIAIMHCFRDLITQNPGDARNIGTMHSILLDFFFSFKVHSISSVDIIYHLKKKSFIVFLRS
jgi:hypothetical protein